MSGDGHFERRLTFSLFLSVCPVSQRCGAISDLRATRNEFAHCCGAVVCLQRCCCVWVIVCDVTETEILPPIAMWTVRSKVRGKIPPKVSSPQWEQSLWGEGYITAPIPLRIHNWASKCVRETVWVREREKERQPQTVAERTVLTRIDVYLPTRARVEHIYATRARDCRVAARERTTTNRKEVIVVWCGTISSFWLLL